MKTILEMFLADELVARANRGTDTKHDGDTTVYSTFVSPEYKWDGSRYIYDGTRCKGSEGWCTYDTDQDASYFGVWYHAEHRMVVTYCEGDETIAVCATPEAWAKEVAELSEFYGAPPPAIVAIDLDGSVTEFYDEKARPTVAAPDWTLDLSREEVVEYLEDVAIQCYDHESIEVLREALRVNVADGTILVGGGY